MMPDFVPVDFDPFDPRHIPESSLPERFKYEHTPQFQGSADPYETAAMPSIDVSRQFIPHDAFEAAALQRGRGVRGGAYDPEARLATPEESFHRALGLGGMALAPVAPLVGGGILAGDAVLRGDPEGAALQMLPYGLARFPKTALSAGGASLGFMPQATGGGLLDSLPENERAMYADQLKQANRIKDQDQKRAAVSAINIAITSRATTLRDQERTMANNRDAAAKWLTGNESAIASLPTTQAAQVRGAAPEDRPALLGRFLEEKRTAELPFTERYPTAAMLAEGGSVLLGAGLPIHAQARWAARSNAAARQTDDALRSAIGATGKNKKAVANELLDVSASKLKSYQGFSPGELAETATAPLIPYFGGTIAPNTIDAIIHQNQPESEAYKHAISMFDYTNPDARAAIYRAMVEGIPASGIGWGIGHNIGGAGLAAKRAEGVLSAYDQRQADIAAVANARTAAASKAAATRAAKQATKAPPDQGVLSAEPMGPPQTLSASPASPAALGTPAKTGKSGKQYPDWATTPALKGRFTRGLGPP